MKSSTLYSIALVSALAVSSVAFAQSRHGAPAGAGSGSSVGAGSGAQAGAGAQGAGVGAQGAASTNGTQNRIHTPGTGLTTDTTPLKTRIHTPGTGLIAPTPETAVAPVAN